MTKKKAFDFILVDIATLIYLALLSLVVLIFSYNQAHWQLYILFNLLVSAIVLLMAGWLSGKSSNIAKFFRHWYPIILFTFIYEEAGGLIHLIFPGWLDSYINLLELKLFGIHPTVWLENFLCSFLNEYMMFCYFSYYFLLPILGIVLYFNSKIKEFDHLTFTSAVAFYISYLGFVFMPVEGPRFNLCALHKLELEGPLFTRLVEKVIDIGGLHGGCMPSSHVAVALVVLVMAYRYHRTLFFILSPIVLTLFVATVYGRFHYVSDVIAGLLVGGVSIVICDRIDAIWRKKRQQGAFQ